MKSKQYFLTLTICIVLIGMALGESWAEVDLDDYSHWFAYPENKEQRTMYAACLPSSKYELEKQYNTIKRAIKLPVGYYPGDWGFTSHGWSNPYASKGYIDCLKISFVINIDGEAKELQALSHWNTHPDRIRDLVAFLSKDDPKDTSKFKMQFTPGIEEEGLLILYAFREEILKEYPETRRYTPVLWERPHNEETK